MMHFLPLVLIPICALMNHLAGQSTVIPSPRIVCRVLSMPLAFTAVTYLTGLPLETVAYVGGVCLIGMAAWACPGWASGFLSIPPYNDTRQQTVLSSIVNWIMGVSYLDKLTPKQAWRWGMIYFTLRGLYIYPLFAGLGYLLTPYAYAIGFGGALMGICYATSSLVLYAEPKMGAVIGAMLAGVLLCAIGY